MKYKVGDKVRVRKDLEVGKDYGNHDVVEDMKKYKGKEFIIDEVLRNYYRLKDENWYYWTDEMLELVEEGEKNNMELEKLNEEYKNKMDKLMNKLMQEYKAKVKEVTKKEEPFIKKGQRYFTINNYFCISKTKNLGYGDDKERIQIGNCYPFTDETKDKVKKEVKLIAERRKLQSEMEMFARQNNEEEIDWNNYNQIKWHLYVDCKRNNIITTCTYIIRVLNTVYFTSKEIAEKALEKFGDRIRKLYIEEEE